MSHPTSPLANAHDEASVGADAEHDLPAGTSLIENSDDLFVQPEALSPEEATVEPLPEAALESMDAEDVIACGDGLADGSEDAPLGVGELAVDDIVMRAERTDDFLRKWRTTSVDRKAEWEVQDAAARQQAVLERVRTTDHARVIDVILDQEVACGLGNVYKSELPFLLRLDPFAAPDDVDDDTWLALYRAGGEWLRENVGRARNTTSESANESG